MNRSRLLFAVVLSVGLVHETVIAQCPEVDRIRANEATDDFGHSHVRVGDLLVVGAHLDSTVAGGAGAVFVFRLDGNGDWIQEQRLFASDAAAGDYFGTAVATDGVRIAVGAPNADGAAGIDTGAVYVFEYDSSGGGSWVEEAKLTAGDADASNYLGYSVGIADDVVVAGAWANDTFGAVYAYRNHHIFNWIEEQKLVSPDAVPGETAGWCVLMDGSDRVFVGVPAGDTPEGIQRGSIDVWDYDGDAWVHTQDLWGSGLHEDAKLGWSLSLSEGQLVAGVPLLTVNGHKDAGGVATFVKQDGSYVFQDLLLAEETIAGAKLGWSVAVLGDLIAAGAIGVPDGPSANEGAAYLWRRWKGSWHPDIPMMAVDHSFQLGMSISLSDDFVLAGTPGASTYGAIYRFRTDEFYLDISDPSPNPGDPLTLQALCGYPGSPVLLVVSEIEAIPVFIPLIFFVFGPDYTFTLNVDAPDPAIGVNVGLQALKFGPRGPISLSNTANIDI